MSEEVIETPIAPEAEVVTEPTVEPVVEPTETIEVDPNAPVTLGNGVRE